jgi:hypothetical protein
VEIWMPNNHRDGVEPGRYRCSGGHTVLVIFQPEEPQVVRDAAAVAGRDNS